MKKLILSLFVLPVISFQLQAQVSVEKQLAKEAIESHIPKHIRNALDQVDKATPDEDGKVVVSGKVLNLVKAGAKRINKLDQIELAEEEVKSKSTKAKVFQKLCKGNIDGFSRKLKMRFEGLSDVEKQIILGFFKEAEPVEPPIDEPLTPPAQ